jgi:ribosome modulation factor
MTTIETIEYQAGYDAGMNGANETNCHFKHFSTQQKMKEWQRGNDDAKKGKKEIDYKKTQTHKK